MKRVTVLAFAMYAAAFALQSGAQTPASSFDTEVQLLRTDLRSQKTDLVAKNMALTDAEAKAFWPIYEEYQGEIQKIWDDRIELIKDYASLHPNVSDMQADNMIEKSFDLDQKLNKLRETYYQKFKRALSAKTAARFMQLDRRINNLAELQIANSIPLLK